VTYTESPRKPPRRNQTCRRVRALRAPPPKRAGFPHAALLRRASGASATWSPPENLCWRFFYTERPGLTLAWTLPEF